jgi:hypothetical protein
MAAGLKHARLILALAIVVAGTASSAPASEPTASRAKAPLGVPVVGGDVSFDVFRFHCGSGKLGDQDSGLDPDGVFCMVAVGVHNRGSDPIQLDPFTYSLIDRRSSRAPWKEAMNELVLDDPNHLFRGEIPAGGGGLETLFFELPAGVRPVRLELHTHAGSDGASLILDRCRWSESGGSCSAKRDGGEIGNAYPRDPALDIAYPHAMELDQPTCFDGREWSGVGVPMGTSGSTTFWGHGTIVLKHEHLAEFKDNDGNIVLLAPTARNFEDERVCG